MALTGTHQDGDPGRLADDNLRDTTINQHAASIATLTSDVAARATSTAVATQIAGKLDTTVANSTYALVAEPVAGGKLAKTANLYDLVSPSDARDNLGLGLAAVRGVGTTSADVAAGNDSRFGMAGVLTPTLIVETATGVWSGDAIARAAGQYPIMFSGTDDPADLVNGINTPANINGGDIWLEKL